MSVWVAHHFRAVVVGVAALVVALTAVTVWLVVDELGEGKQLQGVVREAGPCRAFGVNSPQCLRQADLIDRACLKQPGCAKRRRAQVRRVTNQPLGKTEQSRSTGASRQGGSDAPASSPSPGPGQSPSPPPGGGGGGSDGPGGGGGGGGGGAPGPTPNPPGPSPTPPAPSPTPPRPSPEPSVLDQATDTARDILEPVCSRVRARLNPC